jgi:hypothetical protein
VLTQTRLDEIVPIHNAVMEKRTFIEWDKDDIETLRMMKVDVLALGMLTCIRKSFDLMRAHGLGNVDLASVPREDPATYKMLQKADSIGTFQVESRAQMAMLPRMKPAELYDLVIQVAIVRPGPIQGGMVHPYLRRRTGEETITYPSKALKKLLERTKGVPLFQEQAMSIAIVGARYSPPRPTGCAATWPPFAAMAGSRNTIATASSPAWSTMATHRILPCAALNRSGALATMASPKAMRRLSHGWPMSPHGSNAAIRRSSAALSSTASRWGFTPRRNWSVTRAPMA